MSGACSMKHVFLIIFKLLLIIWINLLNKTWNGCCNTFQVVPSCTGLDSHMVFNQWIPPTPKKHHICTFAPIYWNVYICNLSDLFTLLSLVKRAGAVGGVRLWASSCVFGLGSTFLLLYYQVQGSFVSFSHSPIEIEVSHVFGRFLRSTHLLIVEDDPPVKQRDHYGHKKLLDWLWIWLCIHNRVTFFSFFNQKGNPAVTLTNGHIIYIQKSIH